VFDSFSDPKLPPIDEGLQSDIAELLEDEAGWDVGPDGPSLPIILASAACGVAAGIIGLYFSYELFRFTLPASAALATLLALAVLAGLAAGLTNLLGSEAYLPNISMSCGLLVLSVLFFGVCILSGAITATILLTLGS
jgi:hypothetical protein